MTPAQARAVLRNHARCDESVGGLLLSLRPYRGIDPDHLIGIIEAVWTLAPSICAGQAADREVVADLWNLCFTVRCWTRGPHEPMFHGRRFISSEEKSKLDDWLFQLEHWINLLLNTGHAPRSFNWHLFKRIGIAHRAIFALPLILRDLQEEIHTDPDFTEDEKISNCEVLAAMGSVAAPAVGVLEGLVRVTRSTEVRDAAVNALAAIRKGLEAF